MLESLLCRPLGKYKLCGFDFPSLSKSPNFTNSPLPSLSKNHNFEDFLCNPLVKTYDFREITFIFHW